MANGLDKRSVSLLLKAALISAASSSVLAGTALTLLKVSEPNQPWSEFWIGIALYSGVAATFAVPVAIIFGLPMYLLLRRYRLHSLPVLVLGGAVLAIVPFLIIARRAISGGSALSLADLRNVLPLIAFLAATGCFGGALFWRLMQPSKRR